MCLGVPGRITEVFHEGEAVMAHVNFIGETRRICLNYLPDLVVGDHVVCHAGYAMSKISADDATKTIDMMVDLGLLDASEVGSET